MRCISSPYSDCEGGNQDLVGEEGWIKTTQPCPTLKVEEEGIRDYNFKDDGRSP